MEKKNPKPVLPLHLPLPPKKTPCDLGAIFLVKFTQSSFLLGYAESWHMQNKEYFLNSVCKF